MSTSERLLAGGKLKAAANTLRKEFQRVTVTQLLATALVAAGFLAWRGTWGEAFAAMYGGGIALVATWWYWRGLVSGADADAEVARRALFGGAIQRFVFVAAAFAGGMGLMALAPVPLLAAYGGCQLGYLRAAAGR